ncbi:MAG TPA: hypothetical protein VFS19_04885 [Planctomycetota bacterium]|nr:hypothetical protein [Planctomycetota bacterium]
MTALAALLLAFVPQVQGEDRLKEAWPKLVEAWKAAETFQATPAADGSDEFLRAAGKLHEAFESAGLYGAEGEFVPLALKTFVKARFRGWFRGGLTATSRKGELLYVYGNQQGDPMRSFLDSISRLQALEKNRLDDEDNVQDELATARKALKGMGVTADDTPAPLRRRVLALARALASGGAYPEPARATEEQAKTIREWISKLGHDSIEERDKAVIELNRSGDAALPFLREALKSPDGETVARSRRLLGFGHAPWTSAAPGALAVDEKMRFIELQERKLIEDKVRAAKAELEKKAASEKEKESR